jgi:DNA polymerase I
MLPLPTGFANIWIALFLAEDRAGEAMTPLFLVVANGQQAEPVAEVGRTELFDRRTPPYPTGPTVLLVTFDARTLLGCHRALGWPPPDRVIDLLVEFRNVTNGRKLPIGPSLRGALLWFGLPSMPALESAKSPEDLRRRLAAVHCLAHAMLSILDIGRALLRGRYMCAVARIEAVGVPVDVECIAALAADWKALRTEAIEIIDRDFKIYRDGRFDRDAFADWLRRWGITWPRTMVGTLDLGDDAFRDMARAYPELRPLKDVRSMYSGFDPRTLAIGRDGRNRSPLRPFASRTGRNQPSSKASILGAPAWARHLIKPEPGSGLALIDWQQQEFGIAGALSGDAAMQTAYASGDPYLALAIAAGAAPPIATAASHGDLRERYKACALGVQYGMGVERLARQIARSLADAITLINQHRARYSTFWSWLEAVEVDAQLGGAQTSVFGWRLAIGSDANPRAIRNFPMQANGAEMLRLACCLVTEAGITVCAPNHDALLIEAPWRDLGDAIATTQRLMAEASAVVLDGFELRTSVRIRRAPNRWTEPRGATVWSALQRALAARNSPAHQRHATCSEVNPRTVLLYVSKEDLSNASD